MGRRSLQDVPLPLCSFSHQCFINRTFQDYSSAGETVGTLSGPSTKMIDYFSFQLQSGSEVLLSQGTGRTNFKACQGLEDLGGHKEWGLSESKL